MLKHGHRGKYRTSPTWISVGRWSPAATTPAPPTTPATGAGITVCPRWRDFESFLADVGERPPGTTLERDDNAGAYEPGNVRWATRHEQDRNRRTNLRITHEDCTQTLADWAAETGLHRSTIALRLRRGWTPAEALTRPLLSRTERGLLGLRAREVIRAD